MNWFEQVDIYCERTDFSYWSEPLNAITNAAFLISALVCWRMLRGQEDFPARLLTFNLGIIGIGSYLFHTHATQWAELADVIPIQAFILIYVYFATTRILDFRWWAGAAAVLLFFPFAFVSGTIIARVFGPLNGSGGYMPVALLIAGYGLATLGKKPAIGRGLLIGAAFLSLSLVFRTIDRDICAAIPIGTHFLWHTLNGIMLGWMIFVLHKARAPLARPAPRR
ncbi:ceramidase domain-containing protein [Algicella marina]|uniref:Ceramidase n=1 Tax=Algicella marina TaxID=2683284 RepID=A0A6P1T0J7_9RHOB|nr:ceramidase domain-containing protein [Algicella marina]QHQ34032.1 hypothetical protein GO499_01935 [Algicella marina]